MKEAARIIEWIKSSEKIVITSHRSPDGDSIGSSLGLYHFIKAIGKDARICHPDPCPNFLNWIKEGVEIIDFDSNEEEVVASLNQADLIFCLDYNAAHRLGSEMGKVLTESKGKKVMIDHHLNPENFVDLAISDPQMCSTSQLILELIIASGNDKLIDEVVGTPLYLGIVTDTGSFRFDSVQSRTHYLVAHLLESGVKHARVHENTFDTNTVDRLKLKGYAIAEKMELLEEETIAVIWLTKEELERFNYKKGDTEGLVNVALSISGVQVAVFLSEGEGRIKISFRSKGTIPVNDFSSTYFEGGGHKNAAGGMSLLSMSETLEKLKKHLPELNTKYV